MIQNKLFAEKFWTQIYLLKSSNLGTRSAFHITSDIVKQKNVWEKKEIDQIGNPEGSSKEI